jgi:hypothetical protein
MSAIPPACDSAPTIMAWRNCPSQRSKLRLAKNEALSLSSLATICPFASLARLDLLIDILHVRFLLRLRRIIPMKSGENLVVGRWQWQCSRGRRSWSRRRRRGCACRCSGLALLVEQLELLLALLFLLLRHLLLLEAHLLKVGLHRLHSGVEQSRIRGSGGLRRTTAAACRQTQQRQGQPDCKNSSSHHAPSIGKPLPLSVKATRRRFRPAALP